MAENLKFEDLESPLQATHKAEGTFQRAGVIGMGQMGQGIAETIANAGIDVIAIEKNETTLQAGLEGLNRAIDNEIRRWAKTASEKRAIMSRVHPTTELTELKECEIVIEAVDENFDLKRRLIESFFAIAQPGAVFISNTATLSLSKLAATTRHADRVIGMHFLHPVPQVPLVELVRGMKTSDQTFALVKAFARRIGKTPVEVFEYPGFITTRTILPLLNEAMHIAMEGTASPEDIDTAMRLGYGMQNGPLEMADAMGLDEVLMWLETLYHDLGEPRFRPCPLLRRLVREGKLGKKVCEGFFKYNEDGKRL